MSERLTNDTALQAGRTYWLFAANGFTSVESSAFRAVSMRMPFFPIPSPVDKMGALEVFEDGHTVGELSAQLGEVFKTDKIAMADAGALEGLLHLVATGNATFTDIYRLRDEALDLGGDIVQSSSTLVHWMPWIIAGAAVVGLAVVIIAHARS